MTITKSSGVNPVKQNIQSSLVNYTDANLAYNAEFTGTGEETFGISTIQVFAASDKDVTVYIDQSTDITFADSDQTLTDSFICYANNPCGRPFVSSAPYYRLRVKNTDPLQETTTSLEVATGQTPILSILPTSLSPSGNLQGVTSIRGNENINRHAYVNPTNELNSSPVYRMVGTNFDGETKDTNFWTELVDAGTNGSVTQGGGDIELKTSATATGWAKYTSVRKARFVAGSAQYFSGGFNFKTAGTTDNIRRVGAYTTTDTVNTPVDGFYFELDGTTFSVNSRADAGTVNSVASGSFNGNLGTKFTPEADTYYKLSIEYTPLGAFFYVGDKLLHKIAGAHQSHFMTLPITMENIYTSGAVDVNFETVGMYIARQGELVTNPTSKWIDGANAGIQLKYGAGTLRKVINLDNQGSISIYDGTTTGDTQLAYIDCTKVQGSIDFDIPFSDGLFLVTTDAQHSSVTVYE